MQSVDQEEMLSWYQIAGLHTMFGNGKHLLIVYLRRDSWPTIRSF
jgi:hypothetical protein